MKLFTGADEAEIARRQAIAPKIMLQEWMEEFFKRTDIKKLKDGSYDVDGDLFIRSLGLKKLPLKFNHVKGYFSCSGNRLTTLEGAPKTVGCTFFCPNNLLESLEGGPEEVGGGYVCRYNKLTSLKGAPKNVGTDFWCGGNAKKFTIEDVEAVCNVKGNIHLGCVEIPRNI